MTAERGPSGTGHDTAICGSLYPGGHGEDRICDLTVDHNGPHHYAVPDEPVTEAAPAPDMRCTVEFDVAERDSGLIDKLIAYARKNGVVYIARDSHDASEPFRRNADV